MIITLNRTLAGQWHKSLCPLWAVQEGHNIEGGKIVRSHQQKLSMGQSERILESCSCCPSFTSPVGCCSHGCWRRRCCCRCCWLRSEGWGVSVPSSDHPRQGHSNVILSWSWGVWFNGSEGQLPVTFPCFNSDRKIDSARESCVQSAGYSAWFFGQSTCSGLFQTC